MIASRLEKQAHPVHFSVISKQSRSLVSKSIVDTNNVITIYYIMLYSQRR
jgi:hypothetical protein